MSTRQYIGARYVPKFYQNSVDGSAAWESNVVYEPLTWVTLTNGHLYLSRKQVPATVGTPSQNINYWLDVGSYNGFIEGLQDQIDLINTDLTNNVHPDLTSLGTRIGTAEGNITSLGTRMGTAEGNITSLGTRMGTAEGNITSIKNDLAGKSDTGECVFIGDSFGDDIVSYLNERGFTVTYNSSVGGVGFRDGAYLNQLNTIAATITNKNAVKYVIAIGGTNDTHTDVDSTFSNLVTTFCQRARELFPNARIMVGYVCTLYRSGDYNRQKYKGFVKRQYIRGVEVAQVNAEFIDNLTECIADCYNYIGSDRVHPTNSGYEALSLIIIQAALRQNVTVPSSGIFNEHTVTNVNNGITFTTVFDYYTDGRGNCVMNIPAQTFASNVTVDNSHTYVLIPPEKLPIIPLTRIRTLIHLGSSKSAYLDLSEGGGLRFGYGVGADVAGTYNLELAEYISIPLPLY